MGIQGYIEVYEVIYGSTPWRYLGHVLYFRGMGLSGLIVPRLHDILYYYFRRNHFLILE